MRLDFKLAKSLMENEEGMNHIWIQIFREEGSVSQTNQIEIQLPQGIYRSCNLNGYAENAWQQIVLDSKDNEVIFAIFTQEAIACGDVNISVTLTSGEKMLNREIPIRLVNEDEMDLVEINEQVTERVKQLTRAKDTSSGEDTNIILIQPRVLEIRHNDFSYLEQKYRVDC
ncbi:hypothetical protein [Paenibacillus radicis (ex Gao et al. 2016)]|uniref:Uncharacterized protein n=1 Tax=Paenibacillus radicis (ex Gao et al. 2016) TaxID=1737354 RepID=A0A917HGQ3_9BACL|nr:hypothetical protein [Paenibacillus radicis (ex Gao et al. 2016)]GGG78656.1 hypothetical protein GCM10010918_39510 [Paenibacillus radicis (ex Gao et al. 2016)]